MCLRQSFHFLKIQKYVGLIYILCGWHYLDEAVVGVELLALPECHAHHQDHHEAHPQQDGHVQRVVVSLRLVPETWCSYRHTPCMVFI